MKHKTEDYKISAVKYYLKNKDNTSQEKACKIFTCSKQSLSNGLKDTKSIKLSKDTIENLFHIKSLSLKGDMFLIY